MREDSTCVREKRSLRRLDARHAGGKYKYTRLSADSPVESSQASTESADFRPGYYPRSREQINEAPKNTTPLICLYIVFC